MERKAFIRLLQTEITRHSFDAFVDEPPAVAQGGKALLCPAARCARSGRKTTDRFLQYIAEGLPAWLDATVPATGKPR
jgi:hypothetical protein